MSIANSKIAATQSILIMKTKTVNDLGSAVDIYNYGM